MARQRKMTPERKAFIDSLLAHYQPSDANEVPVDCLVNNSQQRAMFLLSARITHIRWFVNLYRKNKEENAGINQLHVF